MCICWDDNYRVSDGIANSGNLSYFPLGYRRTYNWAWHMPPETILSELYIHMTNDSRSSAIGLGQRVLYKSREQVGV